ncbi:uncharacterized protein LOC129595619 [Paramacrobiotus metropolitanus]|uniref:uncharacterized protein LOC129595619 n=1 Tax=Paramacrobiotus metropolitanus TaxID=2943436 RepID=UPI0024458311|nr:uncharacterized protein LOC129595619 [Paramacrobiotus metropolitanus]
MEEFIVTHNGTEANSPSATNEEETSGIPLSTGNGNKGRHHFTVEEDMALLHLIVERNPFGVRGQRGAVWDEIETALHEMGYDCTIKSCQDRLARLLRTMQSEDAMRKSVCGQTMQTNAEMMQLLEEVIRLKSNGGVSIVGEIKTDRSPRPPVERKPVIRQTVTAMPLTADSVAYVQSNKRTHDHRGIRRSPGSSFKIQRLFADTGDQGMYQKQKLALMREHLDLEMRKVQLSELKFKKDTELEELRLKIEADKVEMETRKVSLEREKLDMERRKQDLEIAERTQHLETMKQQQQVLFQLLTKKLNADG